MKTKIKCIPCYGTGQWTGGVGFCPECKGTGYLLPAEIVGPNPLTQQSYPAHLILQNTDSNEYTALNADKKAWYNLFISAGVLDMRDGTKSNDLFLAWIFPPGTLSHAAIVANLATMGE